MDAPEIWWVAAIGGIVVVALAVFWKTCTHGDLTIHEHFYKCIIGHLVGRHYLKTATFSPRSREKANWFWGRILTKEKVPVSFVASWAIPANYESHAAKFDAEASSLFYRHLICQQQLTYREIYIEKNLHPPSDPKSVVILPCKRRRSQANLLVPAHPHNWAGLMEQQQLRATGPPSPSEGAKCDGQTCEAENRAEAANTISVSLYAPTQANGCTLGDESTENNFFCRNAHLMQTLLSLELPGTDIWIEDPSLDKVPRTLLAVNANQVKLRPICFWLHGGGLVALSTKVYDRVLRRLVSLAGAVETIVVSIDYRLAPEHRFPIPMEDCLHAISNVVQLAPTLGLDPCRIAICGDSAGGALAASVIGEALRLPFAYPWIHSVKHAVLIYPSLSRSCATASHLLNGTEKSLKYDMWYGLMHSATLGLPLDWRQTPLEMPVEVLAKFPPTSLVLFTHDLLYDIGVLFHERLRRAGVYTSLFIAPGMHGFFGADRWSVHGVRAVQWVAEQLVLAFSSDKEEGLQMANSLKGGSMEKKCTLRRLESPSNTYETV